jgi:23S rRNA pseudouridine955/2504/2580 synthase
MAIDKPAGVAVHGGSGVSFGVIERLRMARPDADFLERVPPPEPGNQRYFALIASAAWLKLLQNGFVNAETDKVYLALVSGTWPSINA